MSRGWIVFLALCTSAFAQPASQPSGDELMKQVRDGEQWIHTVHSFRVRFEGFWAYPPRPEPTKVRAEREPFPELSDPTTKPSETNEIAFDERRIYRHYVKPGHDELTWNWDGTRAMGRHQYFNHPQDGFWIHPSPKMIGSDIFTYMQWPRAAVHSFWWVPRDTTDSFGDARRPQEFVVVGREKYRGIDCYVVERGWGWDRYYIGVERPLLHGTIIYSIGRNLFIDTERKVAAKHSKQIADHKQYEAWTATLPANEKRAVDEEFWHEAKKVSVPFTHSWLLDYQEVAPGCWFPATQGYAFYEGGGDVTPWVKSQHEMHAVEVKVNETLPDEMFKIELEEGVQLSDRVHDPPLFYKYKKNIPPDEWQKILDAAIERRRRADEQNSMIGKAPPPFPKNATWINGKAMTWDDLKGKIVIIDVWAEWCAPCQNTLPGLVSLHKKAAENGIVVIGLHTPGSDRAKIDAHLKKFSIEYPICIDSPPRDRGESFGEMSAGFKERGIPQLFLIGRDGKIAAQSHGLDDLMKRAYELLREPTSKTSSK